MLCVCMMMFGFRFGMMLRQSCGMLLLILMMCVELMKRMLLFLSLVKCLSGVFCIGLLRILSFLRVWVWFEVQGLMVVVWQGEFFVVLCLKVCKVYQVDSFDLILMQCCGLRWCIVRQSYIELQIVKLGLQLSVLVFLYGRSLVYLLNQLFISLWCSLCCVLRLILIFVSVFGWFYCLCVLSSLVCMGSGEQQFLICDMVRLSCLLVWIVLWRKKWQICWIGLSVLVVKWFFSVGFG